MPTPISIKRRVNASTYEVLQPETTWTQVADKPATFTPTAHTHTTSDITDLKDALRSLYIYGKAQSAITKGQAVQFAGVQGDHILIKPAVPSEINANPDYFMGIAEATLATNDFGYVLTHGELVGVNTNSYTAGDVLWFASAGSTAGALTATEPTNSNAKIQVASVNKVNASSGIIFVRVHLIGTEIEDIVASGTASSSTFLRGDGQWIAPTATNISDSGNVGRYLLTTASATASTLFFKKNPDHTITLETDANFRTSISAAASSHVHSATDITSGTLVVGRGGTGTTTAPTTGGIIWATSTSAYASTALGTSGQFLQSAGTSTPTWQNLTTNITTISNLAPNTYSSSFSVTGYRWVIITGFKNSALTETVFQEWVDLNDTNQYSATARTRRIVWNNDTSTFGDDLTIQNSTGLRLQFAAGINMTYRLDGVR